MSKEPGAPVHAITVIGEGATALLTCRCCGATASSVIALSRIPCVFAFARGTP